jgi:hypothetical protein
MSAGYYKRRRGILDHLEDGTISLLDLAVHDYLNLKANLVIGNGSSLPPGVCITSAMAIHATCPSQISERAIQRSIEHLEDIGWIRRWNVRGKRGNYPILVCRASVHDLSGNEHRVDGTNTTDWKTPVLVPVGDLSSLREVADAKLSGDREVRIENRENHTAKKVSPRLVGFEVFWKEYPRRDAKKAAEASWRKIPLSEHPAILAAVRARKQTEPWLKDEGRFIPYASTFLNQERWKDTSLEVSSNGHVPRIPGPADCRPTH